MYRSYFTARDALDAALAAGELALKGPQCAVFRYLLEHTMFSGENYGWVTESAVGNPVIARRTGLHENTVQKAVVALNALGLIESWGRPVFAGGKRFDMVHVRWMAEDTPRVPSVDTPEVSSSSFVEEVNEDAMTSGGNLD
jgi:hypothetical protein